MQLGDQIVTVGGRPLAGAVDLLTVLADCDCAREGVAVGVLRAQTDADAVLTELRLYPNPSSADPPATPRP